MANKPLPWYDEYLAFKKRKEFNRYNLPKKGDIITFWGPGFVSACIRILTESPVNHVAIAINDDGDIVHARMSYRVVKQPIWQYMAENWKIKAYVRRVEDLTDEQLNNVIEYVKKRIGDKYDNAAIFHLAIRSITKRILPFLKKLPIFQNRLEFFCSELIAKAFISGARIDFSGKHHISTATPGDIHRRTKAIEQF